MGLARELHSVPSWTARSEAAHRSYSSWNERFCHQKKTDHVLVEYLPVKREEAPIFLPDELEFVGVLRVGRGIDV